jgi:hypothetical protein
MRCALSIYSLGALLLAGCASVPTERTPAALAETLAHLSPTVARREAQRVADCAYATATRLTHEYRLVRPAYLQNILVNTGLRQKGLCYHWTEDLLGALQSLRLNTLEIHWAIARPHTLRESNALVLTSRGQPLEQGIVLDAWRYGGRLYWGVAAADRSYRWQEDRSEYARTRLNATAASRRSPE